MKAFIEEFKTFALKGNVMDMAVGIIIGGAFTAIVNSLVGDIISPLIGSLGGANMAGAAWTVNGAEVGWGNFVTAIINFLLVAFVLFLVIKAINKAGNVVKKPEEEVEEITTKVCPFCKSEVAIDATRCPHCTSELEIVEKVEL